MHAHPCTHAHTHTRSHAHTRTHTRGQTHACMLMDASKHAPVHRYGQLLTSLEPVWLANSGVGDVAACTQSNERLTLCGQASCPNIFCQKLYLLPDPRATNHTSRDCLTGFLSVHKVKLPIQKGRRYTCLGCGSTAAEHMRDSHKCKNGAQKEWKFLTDSTAGRKAKVNDELIKNVSELFGCDNDGKGCSCVPESSLVQKVKFACMHVCLHVVC